MSLATDRDARPASSNLNALVAESGLKEMISNVRLKDVPLLAGWLMLANQVASGMSNQSADVGTSVLDSLRNAASRITGQGASQVIEMILAWISTSPQDSVKVCRTTQRAIALLKDFSPDEDDVSILNGLTEESLKLYHAEKRKLAKKQNERPTNGRVS